MTALEWDKVGEKFYETGIDRGVLALPDGTVVAWNGLTNIEDGVNTELKEFYLDGVKFFEHLTPGDFVGKLSAFTYPEEFEQALGIEEVVAGLSFHEQPPESFHLSYRTKIGNDLNADYGYKIHLLYNLSVVPDSRKFETLREVSDLGEMSWSISGVPATVSKRRSTTQITIDSTKTDPAILQILEETLYGTETKNPYFMSLQQVRDLFERFGTLVIEDHGDGRWSAYDWSDQYITMIDDTTFQIDDPYAIYLDPDTYRISDTNKALEKIVLRSPNTNLWEFTVTNDGTLDIIPSILDDLVLDEIKIRSPNFNIWLVTATNDGVLNISPGTSGGIILDHIRLIAPDGEIWLLTATNDGYLDLAE